MTGRIVLVGTPLGNLGDMAPRAAEELARADLLACEDTRRTGRLLQHLGIEAPKLVRMDLHTEADTAERLVEAAASGERVAVVTDAGMPGLSDPGSLLVRVAQAAGVTVQGVPGPFAGALAATVSGMLDQAGRFVFEGFLPRKGAQRARALAGIVEQPRAVVLYESPHRVLDTVADLAEACGSERQVSLSRELTKMHEETWRGSLGEAVAHLEANPPKGEFVVVVGGASPPAEPDDDTILAALDRRLEAGDSKRDAAAAVAEELGIAPNRVKRLAIR
ncbi:MAG: 16S rRNA (cytidine(1402)-2'-O)-methyltransferase [Actinomycetia bacterium]|nr:16S rRNA (cytidine(1402)-2'-O)-methyltransferase [Actinomycetes bacterium]